jgi:PDZ domain-containing protein
MFEPDWRQPDPPDVKPVKGRNPWTLVIVAGIVAVLIFVAFWISIPIFWRLEPGLVQDVEELVEIEGADDYASAGSLYFTTVRVDQNVTFAEWVSTAFDDERVVVLKDDFVGDGSEEEVLQQAREDMRQSKESARDVAFGALQLLPQMARIDRVLPDAPATDRLRPGDRILSVAGEPVFTSCEAGAEIRKQGVGNPVEFEISRRGRPLNLTLETAALDRNYPDLPLVGVEMNDVNRLRARLPVVEIDTGDVGGPSAGLMFALTIYDRLTPDDLTHGLEIAGTGGIGCDGSVVPIGGVQQKVAAAEDRGAEIFLSPGSNFEEAKEAAGDIDVVAVDTFDDAVQYLSGLS